ncbi:MAG: hypothetical protein Q9212_001559 [Teloschistes hypoglaucus]
MSSKTIATGEEPDHEALRNTMDAALACNEAKSNRQPRAIKEIRFVRSFPESAWKTSSPWNADGKSPDDHARERRQQAQARCLTELEKDRWYSGAESEPSSSPPSGSSSSSAPGSDNVVVATSQTSPFWSIGSDRPSSSGDGALRQRQMDALARGVEFQPTVDRLANEPLSKVKAEQRYWTGMAHGYFDKDPVEKAQLVSTVEQRKLAERSGWR